MVIDLENPAEQTMWIPGADGHAIPGAFWAHIDDPNLEHIVHMQVRTIGGQTTIRELVITRRETGWPFGPGVTAAALRKVNVGRLLRLAISKARRPWREVKVEGVSGRAYTVEGVSKENEVFVGRQIGGRGAQTPQNKLDEVARVYLEAQAEKRSTRAAIKEHFHVQDSQAARLVRAAREAGKLPK